MKSIFVSIVLSAFMLLPAAAAGDVFVTGCTSENTPVRIKLLASVKDQPAIQAAFRSFSKSKAASWFLEQKKHPKGKDWQSALVSLQGQSGGRLSEQNPLRVAKTISFSKKASTKRVYCGG
ncbi:hypothetical protein [Pararhizobium sp. DWP3-4]|uniref:hypothetical protein n=1 Tax=unclassified Pararhizobium TaxID=2643050 RepID=UPI003CFBA11E